MVIGFYCQVSVLVPFHFFALWEFVWGAFWTFIAAITALVQRPLLSWSLKRYFRWSKAKSIYCLHLRITIIQKQNIYTSIFSWSFPKSVEIGKEKYNYKCNHNSYASETPTSYSKFTLEVVDVSSNFTFLFGNQLSVLWMNNKVMLLQHFLKTHRRRLYMRKCWSELNKIFVDALSSLFTKESERKVPSSQEWDDMFPKHVHLWGEGSI